MDELMQALLEAAKPHLAELVSALLAAGTIWLRTKLQSQAAAAATFEVELAHRNRRRDGLNDLPGEHREEAAVAGARNRLPLFAQPLTKKGASKMVKKQLKQAHDRADAIKV